MTSVAIRPEYISRNGPGREAALLDPQRDAAKIRAFFVHPDFARFEMGATLTGIPLYRLRGYREVERVEVPLKNGEFLGVMKMVK